MKILYIGEPQTYRLYKQGLVPSHWLYGAIEMEKDGHCVIWEQESPGLFNDIILLIKHKPQIIFIPNLNIKNHILLLFLNSLNIISIPIYAFIHHSHDYPSGLKNRIFSKLLKGLNHIFFLSELTMKHAIETFRINPSVCSNPGWGPDIEFYERIKTCDKGYYVSTGKENRDFESLIEVFRGNGKPLRILTAFNHGLIDYTDLVHKCKNIPNITVKLMNDSGNSYPELLKEMADSKAIVCPLKKDSLTYCVGLSSITDAEGLKKPLIITANPFHDEKRTHEIFQVNDIADWNKAIEQIENAKKLAGIYKTPKYNIVSAYNNIKSIIFK